MNECYSSKKKALIIISGMPGTGKTYLASKIVEDHPDLVILSYDSIKESFWDRFGFDNENEKRAINESALVEFYKQLDLMMKKGEDIIIEYPFNDKHKQKLQDLVERRGYHALSIYLYGDLHKMYERRSKRDRLKDRHAGHSSNSFHRGETVQNRFSMTEDDFLKDIENKDYDIRIGKTISVDTTEFDEIDQEKIRKAINDLLDKSQETTDC